VDIKVGETDCFPTGSIFSTLQESSRFFETGCVGYSSRPDSGTLDGLLLQVTDWRVSPLSVDYVRSAYFDDRSLFPEDSIEFDHALLMRDISHEWHSEPAMTTKQTTANKASRNNMIRSLFSPRGQRLILALAILVSGMILGILFEYLQFLTTTSLVVSLAIACGSFRSPKIFLDGEQVVLRIRKNKNQQIIKKNKSIGITEIIEWDGYEGKIVDVVWSDKDIWSLRDVPGITGKQVQKSFYQCGFSAIPVKTLNRVFRPQRE